MGISKTTRFCVPTTLLAVAAFLSFTVPAKSQVLYGSLVGTVVDQSGGAVPNATVTITEKRTGQVRSDKSESDGRYTFGNVQPGIYDVKATAPGFRTLSQNDVEVTANTVSRVEVKLEVGQVTETINVEAAATQLQTDKSDTHTELNSKAVSTSAAAGLSQLSEPDQPGSRRDAGGVPELGHRHAGPFACAPTSTARTATTTSPASTARPASTSGCLTTRAMWPRQRWSTR